MGVSPREPGHSPELLEAQGLKSSHIPERQEAAGKSERVKQARPLLQGQQFPISSGCCRSLDTICCNSCWWLSNSLFSAGLKPDCSQSTNPFLSNLMRETEDHGHFGPLYRACSVTAIGDWGTGSPEPYWEHLRV